MKIEINPKYQENLKVGKLMMNLPELFKKGGNTLYKERNIIKSFTLNDSDDKKLHQIVVKKYKKPILFQRIIYSFFRQSKAKRAFYNGIAINKRKIETPCSIGYLEQWEKGLFKYGYYVTGYTNASPISERLISPEHIDKDMALAFADFVAVLHTKGILHHDLNSTNVLYNNTGGHYEFSLIDINRMDIKPLGKELSKKECLNNLTRFTGRMDLFEFVVRQYAIYRNWPIDETVNEAIALKTRHDKRWRQRKAFFKIFKPKKV